MSGVRKTRRESRGGAEREERREARTAVSQAKRASAEAEKLAKTLSRDARASLERLTASARADVRAARRQLAIDPRRAKSAANRAAARLELASLRVTASGDAERTALADSNARKRAKTIKRRRKQAEQARKMAEFVALHTILASLTTPTDREQAEADQKRFHQLGDRVARFARR
jgi:hypothetical protein